ncbi:type II secretion system F family protein [Sinirhodobacter sp. WL0062]|uniref:Type II secretion system F family protein n=1 Tax=Rhodobacter flavimaris TaxID=2907145 RepID=A0ABS8YSG1_9RHOB|nr:type II secretion system F family protein [Sinirhodobacter sp. WL0062]MCE5972030.1 type II secretion system F family protein [Sinirhodobacter sp. WL0062]
MDFALHNQNLIYLIYLGIGLGVLLVFTAFTQLVSRRENRTEARSRRMKMVAEGRSAEERLQLLRPPPREGILARLPFIGGLPQYMRRAGLTMRPETFLTICVGIAVLVSTTLMQMLTPVLAIAAGIAVGIILPVGALQLKTSRQNRALMMQLPDALDMMARGLKIGHPLSTSIGSVARQMNDPIGTEFGIIYDQVSYGDDLPDAFHEFAERVDLEDAFYLAASIGIQHGTGGDLARVLEVLAKVIRGRITMRRKIKAISSEGRASAYFLSLVPVAMYGFTSITAPNYYGGIKDDPYYLPMMGIITVLVVLNGLVLRKLVDFRI